MDPIAFSLALPFLLLVGMITLRMHRQERDDHRTLCERLQTLRGELPVLTTPAVTEPAVPTFLPPPERAPRGIFGRRATYVHSPKPGARHIMNRFNGRQRA